MFLKSVGVVKKKGMECEDMVDLIKIYLFLGETEVNFSRFVNIVRKINSIMKFCNLVLIVKEDPHGRLKTLCNGTNRKPHENQNTSVLIIFFVIIVFLYFHMSFKFSLSSPSHYLHHHQTSTSSKTPKPSCWIYF